MSKWRGVDRMRKLMIFTVVFLVIATVRGELTHRYSFGGNTNDIVGSAHGILINNTGQAGFSNGRLILGNDGSQLSASNDGDYIDLPNGMISANGNQATFEFWVTWYDTTGGVWQEFMSFGTSDYGEDSSTGAGNSTYIMMTPRAGSDSRHLRCGYRLGQTANERVIDHSAAMTLGEEMHIVLVWDGDNTTVTMYVDGEQTAQDTATHIDLSAMLDNNNWLGRSQWNDEMFIGSYNEFRIYNETLSDDQVMVNYLAGPDQIAGFLPLASNPSPPDGAMNIPLDTTLSWQVQISPHLAGHRVYLGTTAESVISATPETNGIYRISLSPAVMQYTPEDLDMGRDYYWRIDEVGTEGQVFGGVIWHFQTGDCRASEPIPSDGAVHVPIQMNLSWNEGFNAIAYNVYMGTDPNHLTRITENLQQNSYAISSLDYVTQYFWRVDSIQPDGNPETGLVWTFTTQVKPPPCLPGDLDGNCHVDLADMLVLADQWMSDGFCSGFDCADMDQSGWVDGGDFSKLAENWQKKKTDSIVINEIHYHPDENTEPIEFIELYNAGIRTVDLSNWQISGAVDYVIPEGTWLTTGIFLVIGENPESIEQKFGVVALGPFEGHLDNTGERLILRDVLGNKVDEVEYKNEFPWPIAADGEGASMELLNPYLDNNLAGSWRASGYTEPESVREPEYLLPAQSNQWRYRKGISEPQSGWQEIDYIEDTSWQNGQTSIGYDDNDDNTLLDDMEDYYVSVYLRHEFIIASEDDIPLQLKMNVYVDDGCVIWINGQEITPRLHVAEGDLPYNVSSDMVDNHESEWETISIPDPANILRVGKNVIAIHAVNDGVSSSDFSIDVSLYAIYHSGQDQNGTFGLPSPGTPNHVLTQDIPPQIRQVTHTPDQPASDDTPVITVKVTDPDSVSSVELIYQVVLPGQYVPSHFPVPIGVLQDDPDFLPQKNPDYFNSANWTIIPMVDTGTNGDLYPDDSIFSVTLPSQIHRTLVRYRIHATDGLGNDITVPYADDPSLNFAYFVYDGIPPYEGITTETLESLPIYHLITRSEDMYECLGYTPGSQIDQYYNNAANPARFAYNWWGTMVYDDVVYDHVRYRLRGANGRYLGGNTKRSMRFRFNRGRYFQARDKEGEKFDQKWQTLTTYKGFDNRLTLTYALNEHINYFLFNQVGVPTPESYYFHFRVINNEFEAPDPWRGDFWGLGFVSETYDVRFLENHNLEKGNLYKLINSTTDAKKQQRYQGPNAVADGSDHDNTESSLNGSRSSDWIRNHVRLDKWYQYHALAQAIRHYDYWPSANKNAAWYFEPDYRPENSYLGLMWTLPWDTDASWGPTWNEGQDRVYASIFPSHPELQIDYYNAVREVYDLLWQPDQIEPLIDEFASSIATFVQADRIRWLNAPTDAGNYNGLLQSSAGIQGLAAYVQDMKNFAFIGGYWPGGGVESGGRAIFLESLANTDQNQFPQTPSIEYIGPAGFPTNRLIFRTSAFSDPQGSSTFSALKWRIAEVTDQNNPLYDPSKTRKYEIKATWESQEIKDFTNITTMPASQLKSGRTYRVRCRMQDTSDRWSHWSSPIQFIAGEPQPEDILTNLRITEIMFNPPEEQAPATYDNDEFEFIELKNIGSVPLDLSNVEFTEGVIFRFSDGKISTLLPGELVLVVRNTTAFEARYGTDTVALVAGQYESGRLDNEGEKITLQDGNEGVILSFEYDTGRGWPIAADGAGHSMVPVDSALIRDGIGVLGHGGNWRASSYMYGSPGQDDPVISPSVMINEFAAHTDFNDPAYPQHDSNDWIELFNISDDTVSMTDWYLSDDIHNLKKWHIGNTEIPAGGFASFDEVHHFHNPITAGFGLDKVGEEVALSYLPGDDRDRIVDCIRFKGQENLTTLGRYPDADASWFSMSPSRDQHNYAPQEHIVIRDIMYHPEALGEEYIEIFNPTGTAVLLETSAGPWCINGQVDYSFAQGTVLAEGSRMFIVGFDPIIEVSRFTNFQAFYETDFLTPGVDIVGPWSDNLSNTGGRVALEKPLEPDLPDTTTPWVIVHEIWYGDDYP
ncbi:MAG: lamin tail domain-containing protein [Sedimentisphaerales bacterium]|nr:lamin tail domain-containing protein [Sedimentisphaerales bacterium]